MEVIMKKILSLSALLAIALFIGAACQTASTADSIAGNGNKSNQPKNDAPKTVEPADDAPRITLADAKKEFDAGNAIFVDTRAAAAYDSEHIKGAINITTSSAEEEYKKIPAGKKIIAYCS